eukprot:jgi/Chrzof1/2978/Cz12g06220.t1
MMHMQARHETGKCSVWVHSTRTCRALTRADVRGEAKQTDRQTYETVSELTITAPHWGRLHSVPCCKSLPRI